MRQGNSWRSSIWNDFSAWDNFRPDVDSMWSGGNDGNTDPAAAASPACDGFERRSHQTLDVLDHLLTSPLFVRNGCEKFSRVGRRRWALKLNAGMT